MNIAIETIQVKNKGGAGVHCFQLVKNLLKVDRKNYYYIITSTYIKAFETPNTEQIVIPKCHRWIVRLYFLFFSWFLLRKKKVDIFHCTSNWSPFFINKPIIVTIHDIISVIHPDIRENPTFDYYINKFLTSYTINKANKIIVSSENTRKDIISYFKVGDDKIKVVPIGYDMDIFGNQIDRNSTWNMILKKYKLKIPYILFVGYVMPKKNIEVLIMAFQKIILEGNDFYLVITGALGQNIPGSQSYIHKLNKLICDLKLKDRIIFTGYVEKEELPFLYKKANLFVYPSHYEGFGIPPLEAMASGTPVIVSRSSSLPEVVGDAGLYFTPGDIKDLSEKMRNVLKNKKLASELAKKGGKQSTKFNWEDISQKTLSIYYNTIHEV